METHFLPLSKGMSLTSLPQGQHVCQFSVKSMLGYTDNHKKYQEKPRVNIWVDGRTHKQRPFHSPLVERCSAGTIKCRKFVFSGRSE